MTYTPVYTDPAFNPATWSLGYQQRQFGVAGPSIYTALASPPAAMTTAVEDPEYTTGGTGEPQPIYGLDDNPHLQEVRQYQSDLNEQENPGTDKETDSGESL